MPTLTFTRFGPSAISGLAGNQLRVDRAFDTTTAYTFGITDDGATWSGDSTTDGVSTDTSQQTRTVRDDTGTIVANQSYDINQCHSITGTSNGDNLRGGDDTLISSAGNDLLEGGLGINTIYGDGGNDHTSGDDVIDGGVESDSLVGGPGRDTLAGGQGADFIQGNEDADLGDYSASDAAVTIALRAAVLLEWPLAGMHKGIPSLALTTF